MLYCEGVFPAPAGMNRAFTGWKNRHPCVPRACGDEPLKQCVILGKLSCSPRLRG